VKQVKLGGKKHTGYVAFVDDEDFSRVTAFRWYCSRHGNGLYAYRASRNRPPFGFMHRFIIGLAEKDLYIDHIDGNGLNNQKSNLRIATKQQNLWNVSKMKNNTSGYRGVSLHSSGLYRARIKIKETTHLLGYYKTPNAASAAYEKAAKEIHGEFYRKPK
jgi:hypothetical protein